ncbi:bifunctional diguanylate cyclase/phosphodiesterase [Solirubrobacter phytolaccae]|uniref:Bifunctional diguanylate cyclase/phosphodiesterase n=1 Tax=Solirubrobacter phytolaccae TaxID=1404360 RepID=A0A9X3NHG9_9ACTN|nr:bifunctional diguanylate cyclase/phosphodiesterase [Solirubrobacter phytolaccae]MDA0184980.1 bifunctional diguanylate cyclase/phosphodiesterase [Solirubrobacter phytolaccae]
MEWIALAVLATLYVVLAVTARRNARRAAGSVAASEYAALHDHVTELPNRVLFHDRVHQATRAAARDGEGFAVFVVDLDRFKVINDTLGHHNGDLLLCTVGARLTETLRAGDSIARLGGDEFAVLVTGVRSTEDAVEASARVRAAIAGRIELEEIGVEVEASVGIALFPAHGDDPEALLQHADIAMYVAKQAHSGYAIYDDGDTGASRENLALIADLRRGIEDDELVLHYQPKANLATGRTAGVEALVRWDHSERGFLYPDAFIALAENTGLIRELTLHVLDRALAQTRAWMDAGLDLHMAVNVSTRNLLDLTLPDQVEALLETHGVPADRLELEITETTIMADPPRAKAVLARLSQLGLSLAVDDFGTGYTSLGWLRDLPVTTLKIDKSFVMPLATSDGDAKIVRSIVQLGSSLGLQVVAEGVEDQASWDILRDLGCDLAQGYHLSKPQPVERLEAFLRTTDSTSVTGGLSAELTA